jgi:hypothetical protein
MSTKNLKEPHTDSASREGQSKRNFDPERYMQIGDDQLVTLSLQFVTQDGKPPSFENIVEEAYSSFPQRFSFQGHPEWPHTLVIDRSIRRLKTDRQKRWISGKAATGYKLLPAGETVAKDTYEKLCG